MMVIMPKSPLSHQQSDDCPKNTSSVLTRMVFFVLGFFFVGLGIVGIFTPLLPTTVFILLAGYCWAKSSERFYLWLYHHKVFGKMLQDWEKNQAIPRSAKYLAWAVMTLSCVFLFWRLPVEKIWMAVLAVIICLISAIWMARFPDA